MRIEEDIGIPWLKCRYGIADRLRHERLVYGTNTELVGFLFTYFSWAGFSFRHSILHVQKEFSHSFAD